MPGAQAEYGSGFPTARGVHVGQELEPYREARSHQEGQHGLRRGEEVTATEVYERAYAPG